MSIDISSLKELPAADKLRIVTELWNDIVAANEPIVVPDEIFRETSRTRKRCQDSFFGPSSARLTSPARKALRSTYRQTSRKCSSSWTGKLFNRP
jgi:hypothetical protein